MKLKRYWYLAHRWLGIAMGLFFAMWFFTGVVMMYIGFPSLERQERLNALPILNAADIRLGPQPVLDALAVEEVSAISLSTVAKRPVYIVKTADTIHAFFADTGEKLKPSKQLLKQSAKQYATGHKALFAQSEIRYLEEIELDQWSVSSSLHIHRPLHRIALGDQAGTVLYLSSKTGQVVRDVNRKERIWNWLGANLHWIYPVQLRQYPDVWADVVVVISIIACVLVITGAVVGFQRLRVRKRYRGKDFTPYKGVAKWHHLVGIFALIFLSTYTLSGLLSMNPLGVFDDAEPLQPQLDRYYFGLQDEQGDSPQFPLAMAKPDAIHTMLNQEQVVELHWQWINGQAYAVLQLANGETQVRFKQQTKLSQKAIPQRVINKAIQNLLPNTLIAQISQLDEYDSYYYSHHNRYRPLPVIKVVFADEAGTWFYIDATTGQVIKRQTRIKRVQRWLYNGLHSLDFNVLIQHRPIWDVVVIFLCVVGFLFSASGVYLAWKRLRT